MMAPVVIVIDGEILSGWTDMTLSRSKDGLTGQLSISIFMGYLPEKPVMVNAARGREILVYIGGHLAFTGIIDRRTGTGDRHGKPGTSSNEGPESSGSLSLSIGPNEYTVRLTARGRTKYLVDSSHQHPTTNMMRPTTRKAFETLVEHWGISLNWLGTEIDLDKVRFRDGGKVIDDLQRLAVENCYFIYETRDGRLRVTDDTGRVTGEPVVLGKNILSFSADQAEDTAKSKIKVKGQRIDANVRGEDAVLRSIVEIEDQWLDAEIPIAVQHYGNGTPEALQRRAQFEANKRSSQSKRVTVDVFHVQQTTGEPWDIGQLHYVEIPPEGIFDVMECVEVNYTVQNDKTLKTTLTFSPPPASMTSGVAGGPTANLPEISSDLLNMGRSRRIGAGVTFAPGQYPSPWSGPVLSLLQLTSQTIASLTGASKEAPPLVLPKHLTSGRSQ